MQTMRDSLDQLKLTVDAIHLQNGDVTSLLANLRYRLEPRFKASETELLWDVDLLEPLAQLDSQGMRHLQFIVYESLSNVLQHAHASMLCIELHATAQGGATLRIIDNGRGFDPQTMKSNGFSSIRERAALIGAVLCIDGTPGRTMVELKLSSKSS